MVTTRTKSFGGCSPRMIRCPVARSTRCVATVAARSNAAPKRWDSKSEPKSLRRGPASATSAGSADRQFFETLDCGLRDVRGPQGAQSGLGQLPDAVFDGFDCTEGHHGLAYGLNVVSTRRRIV